MSLAARPSIPCNSNMTKPEFLDKVDQVPSQSAPLLPGNPDDEFVINGSWPPHHYVLRRWVPEAWDL